MMTHAVERGLSHTVATAITIFYFLLLDLLTRPLTITQVVYHVHLQYSDLFS